MRESIWKTIVATKNAAFFSPLTASWWRVYFFLSNTWHSPRWQKSYVPSPHTELLGVVWKLKTFRIHILGIHQNIFIEECMCLWVSYYWFIILLLFPKKEPETRTLGAGSFFRCCFQKAGKSWEVEMEKLKDILWPDYHYGDLELRSVGDIGIVLLNDRNSGHLFADFLLHWLRVLPKALIPQLRLH